MPHKDAKVESYGADRTLLRNRLDQLGPPLSVDRSRLTHDSSIITRMDISAIFGGNPVSSFPRMSREAQAQHPYRNFLHGNFDHNPFMPPEPGWPGLFFRLDENTDHCDPDGNPTVYRTFARHADKRCIYLGQYTFTKLEGISKQEWRDLPGKVPQPYTRLEFMNINIRTTDKNNLAQVLRGNTTCKSISCPDCSPYLSGGGTD